MTFTKRTKSAPRPRPKVSATARIPVALLIRTLLLGVAAIAGASWALVRSCTHELPPLRAPTAPPEPGLDAGEIPAPELLGPIEE